MATMRIGKFQVLGTLGSGAHSTILHVRRAADSREYALKVVPIDDEDDQKFREQASHEFRVGQMLSHPNLLKILAYEESKNWLFRVKKVQLLLEYVNGKTLDQAPILAVDRQIAIFAQVAAALVHMHRRGVCHADLKPNNIMVGKGDKVKVIDFGLAWIKGEQKDRIQGTPEYIAPETARNRVISEQTDMFNFGATMYRIVTMKLPPSAMGDGAKISEKTWNSMLRPVQDLNPRVPKPLAELIHACLAYDPNRRPERMSIVQEQLDEMVQGGDDSPVDE